MCPEHMGYFIHIQHKLSNSVWQTLAEVGHSDVEAKTNKVLFQFLSNI